MLIPNTYAILEECIESGIRYGIMRHQKYRVDHLEISDQEEDFLSQEILQGIMNSICEKFEFGQNITCADTDL